MYKNTRKPRVQSIQLQLNEIDRVTLKLEKEIEALEEEIDHKADYISDLEESKNHLEYELEELREK